MNDDAVRALRDAVMAQQQRSGLTCWVRDGHEEEDMRRFLAQNHERPHRAWEDAALDLSREVDRLHRKEGQMIGSMLCGDEDATLFGKRIRLTVEWPDGLPSGFTEASLRELGEKLKGDSPDTGRTS